MNGEQEEQVKSLAYACNMCVVPTLQMQDQVLGAFACFTMSKP